MLSKFTLPDTYTFRYAYISSIAGSLQYLSEYETERQRHVVPTILGVDALYRLYRNSWSPVVLARSLGLQATNALNPVKVGYCASVSLISSKGNILKMTASFW